MHDLRCQGPFRGHDPNGICWQLLLRYSTEGWVEVKCPRCKTVTTRRVADLPRVIAAHYEGG